jgi:hypothetical protein
MNPEQDALLAVVGRLDRKPIRIAQTSAAKVLKAANRVARLDSDDTRKGLLVSYRNEVERIKNLKRELGPALVTAIANSNREIALAFAIKRQEEAARQVLALSIADADSRAS